MFNANFYLRFIRCKYDMSSRLGSKVIRRAGGRLNKMDNEQFSIQEKYRKEGKRDFERLISGKVFIMLPSLLNFWTTSSNWHKELTPGRNRRRYYLKDSRHREADKNVW